MPVTVKCRIGIDDRDDYEFFAAFVDAVAPDIDALIVHARAAILGGLSPKENREIPPLKYDYVHQLKRERPELTVVLNGGLSQVAETGSMWRRDSTASCSGVRPIIARPCSRNWSRP